jgi:hypothetical protein
MGITNFDTVQANAFIGSQFLTQGKTWFVRPSTGSDTRDGLSPRSALATLVQAQKNARANKNDVVYLMAESDTGASTTDYQTAALGTGLVWAKDGVHLIGVNAGSLLSQRSRVAFASGFASAAPLMTVSANGCLIAGIELFAGVASVLPLGALLVTGERNVFKGCHIAGIGADTNDIAGAYSLRLSGASENVFDNCAIGLDTIGAGTAANSEILVDTASSRNKFENCLIYRLLDHTTNHPLVKLTGATALDRWLWFKCCLFLNQSVGYAIAQTGNFLLSAVLTQGDIILEDCSTCSGDHASTVKWDVNDRNCITLIGKAVTPADTAGLERMV